MNCIRPRPLTIREMRQMEQDFRRECWPIIQLMAEIDTCFLRTMYMTAEGIEYGPWPAKRDEMIKPLEEFLDSVKKRYEERAKEAIA